MNEIAKRAGVGAGTLYRHFPAREDLILAVYQRDIAQVTGSVDDVLARYPPRCTARRPARSSTRLTPRWRPR